jgi:hypothetical protein
MPVQPAQIDTASDQGVIGGLWKAQRQNGLLTGPAADQNNIVVPAYLAEHKPGAIGRIPVSAQPVNRDLQASWSLTDLQQAQWSSITAAHALLQLGESLDRRA